ncbi:phytoene desaturase family protein [Cytobacillus sp. FJAT-54145]|uniref:Phytoene desaturase family protein n=1 Tax=Cytobacillus spartinae TaxID=3299023 RepID=A0ABW6KC12_9BACI
MSNKRKVAVVGAGPGGLAVSMLLAAQGYDVHIYEKQSFIGGRTSKLTLGEYTFDVGPTFFMMPSILEELFQAVGRNLHDYIDMKEVEPLYTLKFGEHTFSPSRNKEKMLKELEEKFPGSSAGYEKFMELEGEKFEHVTKLLQQPFTKLTDFITGNMLRALPKLNALDTVYGRLSTYFDDERLKYAFSFQSKYLGMSAWECPGTFTILSYLEHKFGLHHPIGGVNQLCEAMAAVIREYGGHIYTDTGVKKVLVKQGRAVGLLLENGEKVNGDDVVINADFGHAATNLFEQSDLKKYKRENIEKRKLSCSTYMLYVGVNKPLNLPHHMILFADDYRNNVEDTTKTMVLSEDPSLYVHHPSKLDPTLAPQGKSVLYVLMPVPNLQADIDWDAERENVRERILTLLEREPELKDIRSSIEEEKIITPLDWQNEMYVYKGATFSLAHSLDQMMYFRPHNKFDDVDHCFLVGGGTHPGSGLPTIFESARISSNLLINQYEKKKSYFSKNKGFSQEESSVWK